MAFWNNNLKVPEKPEDPDELQSVLWDFMTNHVVSWMRVQGMKTNFTLTFMALILVLVSICLVKGI